MAPRVFILLSTEFPLSVFFPLTLIPHIPKEVSNGPFSSDLPGTINRLESTAMEPAILVVRLEKTATRHIGQES